MPEQRKNDKGRYYEIFSEPNLGPILKDNHYNNSYRLKDKPTSRNKYHTRSKEERRFFKYVSNKFERNDTGIIIGEIYVSMLCKRLGVPCVEYKYAVNRHKTYEHRGVACKSFLKKGEKSISVNQMELNDIFAQLPSDFLFKLKILYIQMSPLGFYYFPKDINKMVTMLLDKDNAKQKRLFGFEKDFLKKYENELIFLKSETENKRSLTVDEYVAKIEKYADSNGLKIEDDLRYKLQRMAIIDILTKQYDRHTDNISIIYNEKTCKARLAPMYDNGLCGPFCLNVPQFEYPQGTFAYIKLTRNDFMQIAHPHTRIGKFYRRVIKEIDDNDLQKLTDSIKAIDYDALERSEFLTKRYGRLIERGKDEHVFEVLRNNYRNGVAAIDKAIEIVRRDSRKVEEEQVLRV